MIEAGDYGAAASFNHQKTAHGGLRSLQSLSVLKARESIRERRTLARVAPWLLRPIPFLVGTYRSVMRGRLALRAAFALDDRLSRDRNEGLEPELHLPRARLLSRTATTKLFPGVRQEHLTGGAQWYDYQMVENDRLTFAVAHAADRAGAEMANYVEAIGPLAPNHRGTGLRVRDTLTGDQLEITARIIVNAAGAGSGHLLQTFGVGRPTPLVKAMNLVTAKPAADLALAAPGSDGRMLTLVPWRGRAIIGTSQSARPADPHDRAVRAAEVGALIAQANHAFPALRLTPEDVTLVHRGLVPGVAHADGHVDYLSAAAVLDHSSEGPAHLITIVGTKYTTARAVAERAVTLATKKLQKRGRPPRTAAMVLPGAGMADHEALAIEMQRRLGFELPAVVLRHLVGRYAEAAADIVALAAVDENLALPLTPGLPSIGAEVVHAIRSESALRLSDVVMRRTTLGAAGHPGKEAITAAAALAARDLGWDEARRAKEVADVESYFAIN